MKKIIVDAAGEHIRSALTDDGKLVEILIDRAGSNSVAGNIYAGTVKAILPNQFAFLDIGLEKSAFLNLADKREEKFAKTLKQGAELPVMVVKDPSGAKGAYVTSELNLSGRYVVLLKNGGDDAKINISKKITAASERNRLAQIAEGRLPENCGAIIRTEAANVEDDEIIDEIDKLLNVIGSIERDGTYKKAPAIIYGESSVVKRHINEIYTGDISQIIINSPEEAENLKYIREIPDEKIIVYNVEEPVFDRYFIEPAIKKALERKVWLKSGGFLVIDQTESCFVIDVNTGKFAGASGHDKSVMKVNIEAADEIAYQIRLRNLSGMIIIDFIGVKKADEKALLHERLKNAVAKDRIPVNILDASVLGLFVLTRKRVRKPLSELLQMKCPRCGKFITNDE